jgi:hypothetical protein
MSHRITKSAVRRNMEKRNKNAHRRLMNRVMKNLQTLKKSRGGGRSKRGTRRRR